MTVYRKYGTTTPQDVLDCLSSGMTCRSAAEHLGVSFPGLRQASSMFGWRWRGVRNRKARTKMLEPAEATNAWGSLAVHNPFGLSRVNQTELEEV